MTAGWWSMNRRRPNRPDQPVGLAEPRVPDGCRPTSVIVVAGFQPLASSVPQPPSSSVGWSQASGLGVRSRSIGLLDRLTPARSGFRAPIGALGGSGVRLSSVSPNLHRL